MKTVVITFSSRPNGNCSQIGKLIASLMRDSVLFDYIRTKPFGTSSRVALTCNKNNHTALKLYESRGFSADGNEDGDEIELVMTADQLFPVFPTI